MDVLKEIATEARKGINKRKKNNHFAECCIFTRKYITASIAKAIIPTNKYHIVFGSVDPPEVILKKVFGIDQRVNPGIQ